MATLKTLPLTADEIAELRWDARVIMLNGIKMADTYKDSVVIEEVLENWDEGTGSVRSLITLLNRRRHSALEMVKMEVRELPGAAQDR